MNKELTPLEERLHDLSYVLSYEEIDELRNICYEHSNSWCPLSEFFNDIELIKSENYNKNQAYKDLWLIALIVLGKEKSLEDYENLKFAINDLANNHIELVKTKGGFYFKIKNSKGKEKSWTSLIDFWKQWFEIKENKYE